MITHCLLAFDLSAKFVNVFETSFQVPPFLSIKSTLLCDLDLSYARKPLFFYNKLFIVSITLSYCDALKCLTVSVIGWRLSHSRHQTCAITNDALGNDLAPVINPKCQHRPFHQPLRQVLTSTFSCESRDNARKSPRPRKRSEAPLKRRSLCAVPREREKEGERQKEV